MRYDGAQVVQVVCALFIAVVALQPGAMQAQTSGERVHNVAAGISIVPPAGWHQLVPRPGDAAPDARSGSAAERQAFLEQLADRPGAMLLLFAKDVQFQDPLQTPSILVRVMRTAPLGPRPVDALIAATEGQADPRLAGPIRRTEVSGLPAAYATLRDTAPVAPSDVPIVAHGYFVPLGNVVLFIDMKAPLSSPEATNQVFAEALGSIRIEQ